jgi:hypothetical protein
MSSCVVSEQKDEEDVCHTYAAHACFSIIQCRRVHSSALLHLAVIPMESHEPRPLIFIRVLTQLPSFLIVLGLFRAMVRQHPAPGGLGSPWVHYWAQGQTHFAQ